MVSLPLRLESDWNRGLKRWGKPGARRIARRSGRRDADKKQYDQQQYQRRNEIVDRRGRHVEWYVRAVARLEMPETARRAGVFGCANACVARTRLGLLSRRHDHMRVMLMLVLRREIAVERQWEPEFAVKNAHQRLAQAKREDHEQCYDRALAPKPRAP